MAGKSLGYGDDLVSIEPSTAEGLGGGWGAGGLGLESVGGREESGDAITMRTGRCKGQTHRRK